jgi:mannose-1-phosphate guanylyltransferase
VYLVELQQNYMDNISSETSHFYAVIFAGGSGTRLWPMSRQQMPKQFHILTGQRSLLQDTFDRIKNLIDASHIYVLTTEQFREETEKQLDELSPDNILTEPLGRNTAAATALACEIIRVKDPEAIITTLPSDHVVTRPEHFKTALLDAFTLAEHKPNSIVTIGIQPTEPHTGLGYIQLGQAVTAVPDLHFTAYRAKRFVEKPDLATAKQYLKSGDYVWNAAYFTWRAQTMWQAITHYTPDLAQKIELYIKAKRLTEKRAIYETITPEPIDTAIMESYPEIYAIPADLGWSDVGNWASLHEILKIESGGSSVIKGDHIGVDTENVLILGHNKLIATVGLKDVIVVDTPDVMLICHKDKAQDIKKILDELTEQGREMYL